VKLQNFVLKEIKNFIIRKGMNAMQIFNYDTEKVWDYENGFYLTSQTTRLAKSIAHWELYKKISNVPGDIVEVGTYKGASIIRFLTFREMTESQFSRNAICFDAFGQFPLTGRTEDDLFIEKFEEAGGEGITKDELDKALKYKNFQNYELIEGNIMNTVEPYLKKHNNLKIALLHIDVDVYDATFFCLNKFFDKVTRGGQLFLMIIAQWKERPKQLMNLCTIII
jgi:hypothetical protein